MIGRWILVGMLMVSAVTLCSAQQKSPPSPASGAADAEGSDPSGMYTFLKDGEFVQLNIEDGKLSGYISRFGESESDKGQFIDQFFDKAAQDGDRITFTTKVVHSISYEFKGTIATTPGKRPGQEAYRVIKGTLTQHAAGADGSDKVSQRQVEFKSFPEGLGR